jgi:hypothetical protein
MDEDAIRRFVAANYPGVDVQVASAENGAPEMAWGDTFFIYDPERNLEGARRFPFATIVTKDYGDFDNQSNLDRPGVFRLNIGVSAETFRSLFGAPAARLAAGSERDQAYAYTVLDELLPHPVYATQSFVCVLNPSDEPFERVRLLLAEAYGRAASRHGARRTTREAQDS